MALREGTLEMTAPTLILLAKGSDDPRVTQIAHSLRKSMQEQRPELTIQLAFLDHCPPTGPQVVTTLVNRGVDEMVFVPLDLTHAVDAPQDAEQMLERVRLSHHGLHVVMSRPVGPATDLLNVLDVRLRHALAASHALELDGLVLALPNTGDVRGNALISRRARQWGAHHNLNVVVAFADGSGPGVIDAMDTLREEGRRHIAVGSFFLTADQDFVRMAEQAFAVGAIAVSAPFGCDERIPEIVIARYSYAAMDLLDQTFGAADADQLVEAN